MNVLIIEDEKPAADKLERMLHKYDPGIQIAGKINSVKNGIHFLEDKKNHIDLIFADIQLIDGTSFDIFNKIPVHIPVIFVTAYDEYALKAFELNSIDYLLKPIKYEMLEKSMDKLNRLRKTMGEMTETKQPIDYQKIAQFLSQPHKEYKDRFMIRIGEHIKSVPVEDIKLFYAEGRDVYLLNSRNRNYLIDYKMEELTELLDPRLFFRVNRTYLTNIQYIEDVIAFSSSRLKINAGVELEKEIIVSREKVNDFKKWFGGEKT
jgi:DNA-binding LytR/AlgR family response regulator